MRLVQWGGEVGRKIVYEISAEKYRIRLLRYLASPHILFTPHQCNSNKFACIAFGFCDIWLRHIYCSRLINAVYLPLSRHIYCSRLSNAIRTSSLALHSASAIFGFATYTVHASAMQFEQVRLHCIRLLRIFARKFVPVTYFVHKRTKT